MSFLSTRAAIAVVCVLGIGLRAEAQADCYSHDSPYIQLEGSTSEIVFGARTLRGAPRATILCDRAIEMSGNVVCTSPWLGIDPGANLSWRATDLLFVGEVVLGPTITRSFRGGPFTVVDEASPTSPVLVGHLDELTFIWNMNTLSGMISAPIEFTDGSAPQVPGPNEGFSFSANLSFDGDATAWETLVAGAIAETGPYDALLPPVAERASTWGRIKELYR